MDKPLKELIEAVCSQSEGSHLRRKGMHRLLIEVQQLPGILKSSHPDYLHALNQTWEWLTRYICITFEQRASLEESLVKWINGYLYWRIRDLLTKDYKTISLDKLIGDEDLGTNLLDKLSDTGVYTPYLSGLDIHIEKLQKEKIQRIGLELEYYIQQDPARKLQNCYPRAHPNCNCQFLCQKRFLKEPPDTYEEIAQELNMKQTQITNHWYGRCKPLLQGIVTNLGYGQDEDL